MISLKIQYAVVVCQLQGVREQSSCKAVKHMEEWMFEADTETEELHVLQSMSKEKIMYWDEQADLQDIRILLLY